MRDSDSIECRCGSVLESWSGGIYYTAEQMFDSQITLISELVTTHPVCTIPSGASLEVIGDKWIKGGHMPLVELLYLGQTYAVESYKLDRCLYPRSA